MWVSAQFCAKNPLSSKAHQHTGKFNLVHKMQQRTLRAWIVNSHYVAAAYKYMRSYALRLHNLLDDVNSNLTIISASCDDKCKVILKYYIYCYIYAVFIFVFIYIYIVFVSNIDNALTCVVGQHRRALTPHPVGAEGQGLYCALRMRDCYRWSRLPCGQPHPHCHIAKKSKVQSWWEWRPPKLLQR